MLINTSEARALSFVIKIIKVTLLAVLCRKILKKFSLKYYNYYYCNKLQTFT